MLRLFTGDLNPNNLKNEISDSPDAIIRHDFGWLGGRAYFIKPDDSNAKEVAALINLLDQQKDGRISSNAPDWFVGGGGFILKRTDEYAQDHHNLFIKSLKRPTDYIDFTRNALRHYLASENEFNLRDLTVDPIRHALAKGMFDTDGLTPDFANALKGFSEIVQEMGDNLAQGIFMSLVASYYPKLFKLNSQFLRARDQYVHSIEKFIASQSTKILDDLHRHGRGEKVTNILSLSVMQLMKEQRPDLASNNDEMNDFLMYLDEDHLAPYLKNSYLRTVPGSIAAGDNTMIILSCGLTAIATNPALMNDLRKAIYDAGITATSTPDEIETAIKKDKGKAGFLDRFFLECMRRESLLKSEDHLRFESMMLRHTDVELKFAGTTIEKDSMVFIIVSMPRFDKRKWQTPATFDPSRFFSPDGKTLDNDKAKVARSIFSTGRRMCPANFVSEYIFKTYIAEIAMNYNLVLERDNTNLPLEEVKDQSKVRVKLLPLPANSPQIEDAGEIQKPVAAMRR